MSSNRGRGEGDWFLILSGTEERTWVSFVPGTQQRQSSPGDGSLSSHLARAEAGLAAARGTTAGKLQRHFVSQALDFIRNGRKGPHLPNTHTCTPPHSHPPFQNDLKKLPATGKHQLLKIRLERDKATKINSLAIKQMWPLRRGQVLERFETAHLPNKRACKQSETSVQVRGILPAEVPEGSRQLDAFPFQRGHLSTVLGSEGCPSCVPAPVLWKLNKIKPFLLLSKIQTTTTFVQRTGSGKSLAEAQLAQHADPHACCLSS